MIHNKNTRLGMLSRTLGLCIVAAALASARTPAAAQAPASAPASATASATVTSPAPPPATPTADAGAAPDPDHTSYLFGLTFGEQLHRVGIRNELTIDAIMRGMRDGLGGKGTTPADRQQLQGFVASVMQEAVRRNQAAAKDFLARNGQEKGVVTTASGLQYRVILPGDRKAPNIASTDEVTVQYRGKLLDGTEFDSTYARGAPASFAVNGVIPGWQEALVMMKPGARWQLFVPPELGYGLNPKPGIPGGSLLMFDVELVSVKSSGASAAPAVRSSPKPAATSK